MTKSEQVQSSDAEKNHLILILGAIFGGLTLLFFMALIFMAILGHELPCGSRPLAIMVLALGASLASSFIGGSAAASGAISIPYATSHPVKFSVLGGIAVLIILLVIGHNMFSMDRCEQESAKKIADISPDTESRFRAQLDKVEFFKTNNKNELEGKASFILSGKMENESQKASIFLGLAEAYDADVLDTNLLKSSPEIPCPKIRGCLAHLFFNEYEENPILVRGGKQGSSELPWMFKFPSNVKRVLIYWKFYQLEGDNNARCIIDKTKTRPVDLFPYLKLVSKDGKDIEGGCYNSTNMNVFQVKLE